LPTTSYQLTTASHRLPTTSYQLTTASHRLTTASQLLDELAELSKLTKLLRLDTEIFHSAVEVAAVDAHFLGGFCDVAVKFGEFVQDKFAVICIGRFFERRKAKAGRRFFAGAAERRKIG